MQQKVLRIGLRAALALTIVLAGVFMSGPRPSQEMTLRFSADRIGGDPEAWLAGTESRYSDIRPGLAKEIIWADPVSKARTPLAIIYVHGFSASKGEVRPLPDLVAQNLGANLFYTRLAGHGRSSDAMGEATLDAWGDDMAEALAIGERIGERTIVIATSTGATLSTLALTDPVHSRSVAGVVYLSPNFGLKARGSSLLTAPWARRIAHLVLGERRSFVPVNAAQAVLWTTEYSVDALLPMAALVRKAASAAIGAVTVPALFVYRPDDTVVDAAKTDAVVARWGGQTSVIRPDPVGDPNRHVIAGDALSPDSTAPLARDIISWIETLRP